MAEAKRTPARKVVTAPLVQVSDAAGRVHQFYRGQEITVDAPDQIKRLEDMGMVGEPDVFVVPGVAVHPVDL